MIGTREVSVQVALADDCVMVIVQFLKRTWPWSSKTLESKPNFDPRMVGSGRGVLFPLAPGVIEKVRRVGVRRIVSQTRFRPARSPAPTVCACAINWTHPDVVEWYVYEFTKGDDCAAPPHRTKRV